MSRASCRPSKLAPRIRLDHHTCWPGCKIKATRLPVSIVAQGLWFRKQLVVYFRRAVAWTVSRRPLAPWTRRAGYHSYITSFLMCPVPGKSQLRASRKQSIVRTRTIRVSAGLFSSPDSGAGRFIVQYHRRTWPRALSVFSVILIPHEAEDHPAAVEPRPINSTEPRCLPGAQWTLD